MSQELNREKPVVRLRAFRAIDDPASCELFIEGHTRVLTSIGVTKVTSSRHDWMFNPAAFVIIVESLDKSQVYGGARIHVAGGSQLLPIEEATGRLDETVYQMVKSYAIEGTGEVCGLWNSREIAGYGIGSIFMLRATIAITSQLGLKSLLALCAPYTVDMAKSVGYKLEDSVGNAGTFYYPKLDLIATAMALPDINLLTLADEQEKNAIFNLRNNLAIIRIEELRGKKIEIHYEISIDKINEWNLAEVIHQSQNLVYPSYNKYGPNK